MLYFVKGNKLHRYPVPDWCGVVREKELLRDTVVHGVEECVFCMRRWPAEEKKKPRLLQLGLHD